MLQETLSVDMVREFCTTSDKMEESDIHSGDKTLSWDGNIIYYERGKAKAVGRERLIPIQIKGKEVRCLSRSDYISYPIAWRDLNNYFLNKGILYIVVEIEKETFKRRMYAKVLLPVDLKFLLKGKKQKTRSVKLYSVANNKALESLCEFFTDNWPKQSVLLYKDENHNLKIPKEFVFSGIRIPEDCEGNLAKAIVRAEQGYLYAKQDGIEVPLLAENLMTSADSSVFLQVGDSYAGELKCHEIYKHDMTETYFNNMFIIKSYYNSANECYKNTIGIQCKAERTISEVEAIARMIEGFFSGEVVSLNGSEITETVGQALSKVIEEKQRTAFRKCIEVASLCRELNFDLNELTIDEACAEYKLLRSLKKALVDGEPIMLNGDVPDKHFYYYQKIGTKEVFLCGAKQDDGKTMITDPFSDKSEMEVYYNNSGKSSPVSKWLIIEPDRLPNMLIDKRKMLNELKNATSNEEISGITQYLLALLRNYDKTRKKGSLQFADELCELMLQINPEDTATKINAFQIKARKNVLTKDDRSELSRMKASGDYTVMACSAILLGQTEEYEAMFSKLLPEQQEEFSSWPICNLIKRDN